MPGEKLRFRFAKTGTFRLLSHHDLMRCLERMLRRADLPFKTTAGFHPTPRVVFALSLPLGVVGLNEVVEIEFTRPVDELEAFQRLRDQSPNGLDFTSVKVIPLSTTARPRRVTYRIGVPNDRADTVSHRCAELLAQEKVWVDRLKPTPKRLNIRPYLRNLALVPVNPNTELEPETPLQIAAQQLILDFWVTQTGTCRADELLRLLSVADLIESGAIIERTTIELHDEVPNPDPSDVPPGGPAETLPLEPAAIAALEQQNEEQPTVAAWGLSPAGPVVE